MANSLHAWMPVLASPAALVPRVEDAWDVAAYVLSRPRPAMVGLKADDPVRNGKPMEAACPPCGTRRAETRKYGPFPPC